MSFTLSVLILNIKKKNSCGNICKCVLSVGGKYDLSVGVVNYFKHVDK